MNRLIVSGGKVVFIDETWPADVDIPDSGVDHVHFVPTAGGPLATIAINETSPTDSLSVDGDSVYWFQGSHANVRHGSFAGGEPLSEPFPCGGGFKVRIQDGIAYVANACCTQVCPDRGGWYGRLAMVPLGSADAPTLLMGDGPYEAKLDDLYVDADGVVAFAELEQFTNRFTTFPLRSTRPSTIVGVGHRHPTSITATRTRIYWADPDDDLVYSTARTKAEALRQLARNVPVPPSAPAIAADEDFVYVADVSGRILKYPAAGGEPIVLASKRRNPAALALDDDSIYWRETPNVVQPGERPTKIFKHPK